jgi:hypothetical protein
MENDSMYVMEWGIGWSEVQTLETGLFIILV